MVPQDPFAACDPLRPIRDHLYQAWRAPGRRPDPGEVDDLLARVGLDPARTRARPHQWSGGMLQQATIAAATAHRPGLVIADEPTSALDAELREEILTVALLAAVPRPGQVSPGRSPAHLQTWPTHQPAAAAPSPPAAR